MICRAIACPASDRGHAARIRRIRARNLPCERNELKRDLAHGLADHPLRPLRHFESQGRCHDDHDGQAPSPRRATTPRPHPLAVHRRHRGGGRRRRPSGSSAPEVGKSVGVLGTMFVALIKMMIAPVIFCTIVLGIGSVRKAATVGKVGGLAFVYFLAMSTFALGDRPASSATCCTRAAACTCRTAPRARAPSSPRRPTNPAVCWTSSRASSRPRCSPSLTEGTVLQALFVALLVGLRRCRDSVGAGEPILRGVEHLQKLVFKVLVMILWLAPIGAFGAIANVVGQTGWAAVGQLLALMLGFYLTCAIFVFGVLGVAAARGVGRVDLQAGALPGPRVSADRVDLVVGVGAAAADRQDGAPRRRPLDRRRGGAHRLFVQPRRHRDLPDHGVAVHRRRARRPAVASASRSVCWCS